MSKIHSIPETGQAVLVRRRPALVRDVLPYQSNGEVVHLVDVEYLDGWSYPAEDQIAWEAERGAVVLTRAGLPRIDDLTRQPDPPDLLGAFLDALRWSSVARIPGLTSEDEELISPWRAAIAAEPYQLEPVLRALEMPRVSLLLADDVGLGKTIEAGLILTELLARRRIRRVLIVCPASLQLQWHEEMQSKFSLGFTVLDRTEITEMQREYGMDANPWALAPRIITSMDFLRQPDVKQQFLAGSRALERGHALPWDLFVVDEAHNMSPLGFSDRSDRSEMLGDIAPFFEHKLFLTATPHNGFTHSFSGLLELLDPVRFRQTAELTSLDHSHLNLVMVRRLKSELNAEGERRGEPRPFAKRKVEGRQFIWTAKERTLADSLRAYRDAGRGLMATMSGRERRVGRFIFSLLTKRLLSSTYAFAKTWWQHMDGFASGEGDIAEVDVARRRAESTTSDDQEKADREEDVARRGGSWLLRHGEALRDPRETVSRALEDLGWTRELTAASLVPHTTLPDDGKWKAFEKWLADKLLRGRGFREDERVILFTEYKDTLDYINIRLERAGYAMPIVRSLFGGSTLAERDEVKQAFNDPVDELRVLVATDVASEGLNLQRSCRYVFHFEIPWNPMRLEQRNGRVDRHSQARDVVAFHFTSKEDADVEFLDYVVRKVESARDDLGSVSQVIDRSVEERFTTHEVDQEELDRRVEITLENAPEREDLAHPDVALTRGDEAAERLAASERRLHLAPSRLHRLLDQASRLERGRLAKADTDTYRFQQVPESWRRLIDDTVRIRRGRLADSMPALTFDTSVFQEKVEGRVVFRERPDIALLRLGHPLMRRAIMTLRGQAWESDGKLARWTVGASADVSAPQWVVYGLLQATNEQQEIIHEEIVPIALDQDGAQAAHSSDAEAGSLGRVQIDAWRKWGADKWDELRGTIEDHLGHHREDLQHRASDLLETALSEAQTEEKELFKDRLAELAKSRGAGAVERTRRQLHKAEEQALQLTFDPDENSRRQARVVDLQKQIEEEEWKRIDSHRERLRERVEADKRRVLDEVLPRKFALARLDLMPLAVELLVPDGAMPS